MKDYITWKERSNYGELLSETIELNISPGIIIGRGGKTIQLIENTTNTKIRILREENKIRISGYATKYIEHAKNKINKITDAHYEKYDNKKEDDEGEGERGEGGINFLDESNFPSIQNNFVKKNTNIPGVWGKKPDIF